MHNNPLFDHIEKLTKMTNPIAGTQLDVFNRLLKNQIKPFGIRNSLMEQFITSVDISQRFPKHPAILSGLNHLDSLNSIKAIKAVDFLSSQSLMLDSLTKAMNPLNTVQMNTFNGLNVALGGITTSYLNAVMNNRDWEGIEELQEVNESIANITEEFIEHNDSITKDDLKELEKAITEKVITSLSKNKREITFEYILFIIAVLGFFLQLYFQQENNKVSERIFDRLNTIEYKTEKNEQLIKERSNQIIEALQRTRIATNNVNLRYSNHKRSKILGVVKKGQEVTVIEIRHKWLLIAYLDDKTNEPMSGFVYKKYLKNNDV